VIRRGGRPGKDRQTAEHALDAVACTTLDEVQMASLARCSLTKLPRCRDGEPLFEAGDRGRKLDVVKSGEIESRDESGETPRTLVVLRPRQFTGDITHLTDSPVLVTGFAGRASARSTNFRRRPCGNSWIAT
jgi:thioredoxin reductase (NADPH)